MSVIAQPSPPPPPPPASSPPHTTNTDYYYLVLTVAAVAVILVLSNIIAFACCSPCHPAIQNLVNRFRRRRKTASETGHPEQSFPIMRYKKEEARYGTDCSVCLMPFREGEEVRQLPICMHLYHVACIDTWLWLHSSCPVCRGRVRGLPPLQRCPTAGERPLFTESRSSVAMITVPIMF